MEQNQVENDYVEQTVNNQTPTKRSKKWWVVLIIVLIIIAIGGGYYYWNNQKSQNENLKSQNDNSKIENDQTVVPTADSGQTTTSSTETPATTDETADWKTYTNDEYGLSFKYPNDWELRDDAIQKYGNNIDDAISRGASHLEIQKGTEYKLEIYFSKSATGMLGQDMDKKENYFEIEKKQIDDNLWSVGKSNCYENDNYWCTYSAFTLIKEGYLSDTNAINVNVYGYWFTGYETSTYNTEKASLFNQILSTFKFTSK